MTCPYPRYPLPTHSLAQSPAVRYDRDGNGTLSPLELSHLLADLGEQVSAKQANEWMRRLDPDGSGAISQAELLDVVLQC